MSYSDLYANLDSYADRFDDSDDGDDGVIDAAWALLDELRGKLPVWPATAEALAAIIGWEPGQRETTTSASVIVDEYDVPAFLRGRLP